MDKTFAGLAFLFFLSFTLFVSFIILNRPVTQLSRATPFATVSAENSLIFAWPLTAAADGRAESTVTVFVRNNNSQALGGKQVSVDSTIGTTREAVVTSDRDGKAVFHLTSTAKGVAEITAMVDNIRIQKSVSVKFE